MVVGCLLVTGELHLAAGGSGSSFYVAPDGADSNAGTSPSSPWRSLTNINNTKFEPGDRIHLKAGGVWNGLVWLNGSGNSNAPIVLTAYGEGPKPVIDAQGSVGAGAVNLVNGEYWTISNLEVANWAGYYAKRFGIYVLSNDGRDMRGIQILNNTVRDVFASPIRAPGTNEFPSFYAVGGIYVNVEEPARGETILIAGNTVTNIVGEGICFWGESELVGGGVNWWNLSPDVVVRSNRVSHTAGDGILILGTTDELVEHNVVGYAGALGVNGTDYVAGMWPTRHHGGLWQFNEVHHTKVWLGDGQGFDNDVLATGRTIFQYNYSHDNEGGFLLDCCSPDAGQTVARYNISVNESVGNFYRNNALFYNNIFYNPTGPLEIGIVAAGLTNTFYNNIFWGTNLGAGFGSQIFRHNLYYGGMPAATNDPSGILANPHFINPNTIGLLEGFKVLTNSPVIGSGLLVANNGGRDFWGYWVTSNAAPNRGADNSAYLPSPTSIQISGPDSLGIPAIGLSSSRYTATVRDQLGLPMPDAPVQWSLHPGAPGVWLDPLSGLLQASSNAPLLNTLLTASLTPVAASLPVSISPLVFNSAPDFSNVQGQRNWHYQYATGATYADMQWDAPSGRWNGSETYLLIMNGALHPGNNGDAVLKWVAPAPGIVRVTGTVRKGDIRGGDGILASIAQGTNFVWGPAPVAFNDATGTNHDIALQVRESDFIYFRVNANSGDAYDTTLWSPSVFYTTMLNPTNLTTSRTGTGLTINWPGDHMGWVLMTQTNRLDTGVSLNAADWQRVPGTHTNTSFWLTNLPAQRSGFFRLVYP